MVKAIESANKDTIVFIEVDNSRYKFIDRGL
jgi:hypothetical protein